MKAAGCSSSSLLRGAAGTALTCRQLVAHRLYVHKGALHAERCCQRHSVGQRLVLQPHPAPPALVRTRLLPPLLLLLLLLLPVLVQRHLQQHPGVPGADGEGGHGGAQLCQLARGGVQRAQRHQAAVRRRQQGGVWGGGEGEVVDLQEGEAPGGWVRGRCSLGKGEGVCGVGCARAPAAAAVPASGLRPPPRPRTT
jgi:hypothetical protein